MRISGAGSGNYDGKGTDLMELLQREYVRLNLIPTFLLTHINEMKLPLLLPRLSVN